MKLSKKLPRKLIIFDCDGTLVDSQHMIVAAMNTAFTAHGLATPQREDILSVVGLSLTTAVARLVPDALPDAIEALAQNYKAAFAELRTDPEQREPLYPGIRQVLADLNAMDEVVLGMATGKSLRGVHAILAREGWTSLFATVQTADTHPSKPDPSMLLTAMADTGCTALDTVMIGDTTFDIEMARAAGVHTIGVDWGYHEAALLHEAGAHYVVSDAKMLCERLTLFAQEAPEV